jgi:ribonuclease R
MGLGVSLSDDPTPGELQAIALATRDRPDAPQIHAMLLRSMQQAHYTASNSGHFGLAYDAYTHFTSPIRRYPDLLVHRVIKALLNGKRYHLASGAVEDAPKVIRPAKGGDGKGVPKRVAASAQELEIWNAAGAHCSANERRADEASRDVEAWLKCRYMRERLGEEFSGTVSAVVPFGLFVTLDDLYVEGLLHITEIGGGYYRYDEVRQELHGERSGVRYAAGTRVRVQVSRVDLDSRRIDFRMVREGDGERLIARGRKADARSPQAELAAVRARDRAAKKGLARAAKVRSRVAGKKSLAKGTRVRARG